jgi:hypothetical protein
MCKLFSSFFGIESAAIVSFFATVRHSGIWIISEFELPVSILLNWLITNHSRWLIRYACCFAGPTAVNKEWIRLINHIVLTGSSS